MSRALLETAQCRPQEGLGASEDAGLAQPAPAARSATRGRPREATAVRAAVFGWASCFRPGILAGLGLAAGLDHQVGCATAGAEVSKPAMPGQPGLVADGVAAFVERGDVIALRVRNCSGRGIRMMSMRRL
jgi:hypothetical protein